MKMSLNPWSPPQENPRLAFSSSNVGFFEYQIQGIDNRLKLSKIVKIKFSIGRVWYLDPKLLFHFGVEFYFFLDFLLLPTLVLEKN